MHSFAFTVVGGRMSESIEAKVTAILASLLAVERVSRGDDFFMLGGDSLAATVLMSALEANYGVVIDPVEIFERPTVGEFVDWLDGALRESGVLLRAAEIPPAKGRGE